VVDRIKSVLYKLFEEYKIVRRIIVFWAVITITWTTYALFSNPTGITDAAADAYLANIGLLATVIAFYQWSRGRDKDGSSDNDQN